MSNNLVAKLIVAVCLAVSPAAALATETSTAQPANASAPAAAAAKDAPATAEKKICKQLPSSSSRLPQRVCLTDKEWKQVDADSQ